MAGIIISESSALPRDIDVVVNVSKPQAETATDFSKVVFCTPNAAFDFDSSRIRLYTSFAAVLSDFDASSEAARAATDFFSQSPRTKTFAVARIFEDPQSGFLQGGVVATKTLEQWKAITTGSFNLAIDGVSVDVTAISFAEITTIPGIAGVLQTAIRAASVEPGFAAAVVTYNETDGTIRIASGSTGETSTVGKPIAAATGVDISGVDYLNLAEIVGSQVQPSYAVPGYIPAGIASELNYIKLAAEANGAFMYGWTLDKEYRDTDDIIAAAAWIEAQTAAIMVVTTNSPMALNSSSITDVGYLIKAAGYHRTVCVYHNNSYYYPDVAILAYTLHVNYAGINTTVTTKFKDLFGIPTVAVTISELAILENKRINTFTLVGNSSRTFREGVTGSESWFIDDLVNLDNFKEELQVAIYNVFLQNKKVPYNVKGVTLLNSAITSVCERYVKNGTLSERSLSDEEKAVNGRDTEPGYIIEFTNIADMTISDRAKRIGPPANVKLNLAGAIHSLTVNVEAYA